jgi:hypothetical protein
MSVDSPNQDQAATANSLLAVLLGAPFNESEQLGSHESASRINVETDSRKRGIIEFVSAERSPHHLSA